MRSLPLHLTRRVKRAAALSAAVAVSFGSGMSARGTTELDVNNGSMDLTAAATYTPSATPAAGSDITFTNVAYSPAAFTIGGA